MSDPVSPRILFLDPDHDFLEEMEAIGNARGVQIVTVPYSSRDKKHVEEILLDHYPDIIVINLDQDNETDHGQPVLDIRRVPLPIPPIILGTTARDAVSLKQRCYDNGIDDYLIRPFRAQEVWMRLSVLLRMRSLQHQLNDATRKLSAMNTRLTHSNKSLEVMTITDELTGLNNMRFMTQYLDKQFQLFARYDRPFSVLMIDLDKFKEVNDQNDHLVGSETIKIMGRIIHENTRGSDIKARYGGDEYIVAMPETEGMGAYVVGDRIREAIEAYELTGTTKNFNITASIGVANFEKQRHVNFRDIIRDADIALYMAKKGGRNRIVLFDISMGSRENIDNMGYDETQSSVFTEIKKNTEGH